MSQSSAPPPALSWRPSKPWLDAFAKECTVELYATAHAFAKRRALAVHRVGGYVDDYYAEELVQNILSDTLAGVLRWEPGAKSLQEHVWDAIRTRTYHDRRRAERYRHERISVADSDANSELLAEIDGVIRSPAGPTPRLVAVALSWLAELRKHAAPGSPLARLLDALEAGATTKSDVLYLTGMSKREYHAARQRLARLVHGRAFGAAAMQPSLPESEN